jgi:predicted RNase H-like HicB family nuclease
MQTLNFLRKKEILPEVLQAINWKLPDTLEVEVKESENGGFYAVVKNIPGCITQADSGQELYEMVNDAVYTHFEIPKEYIPFVRSYIPSEE